MSMRLDGCTDNKSLTPQGGGGLQPQDPQQQQGQHEYNDTMEEGDSFFMDEMLMYTKSTLPPQLKKFWQRRYSLFSKYDEGIFMSSELWYSVTPESTAAATAAIIKHLLPEAKNVLDVCCGGGGNTIQFGLLFDNVGAVDVNETNVFCTVHNAEVYGVDNVWTVTGDWREIASRRDWIPEQVRRGTEEGEEEREEEKGEREERKPFDFIFCSPPWGGMDYSRTSNSFDLEQLNPLTFSYICDSFVGMSNNFGLFLPKSSDMQQLNDMSERLYGDGVHCRVIQLEESGYYKGILVLFGPDMVAPIDYYELQYHVDIQQKRPWIE